MGSRQEDGRTDRKDLQLCGNFINFVQGAHKNKSVQQTRVKYLSVSPVRQNIYSLDFLQNRSRSATAYLPIHNIQNILYKHDGLQFVTCSNLLTKICENIRKRAGETIKE
jgi:hypothetical protein